MKTLKLGLGSLRFRTRLFMGFGIILILNIALVIIAILQINRSVDHITVMYEHPLAVSNAVREINGEINAIHRAMKDVVLSENETQLNAEIEFVQEYDKRVQNAFDVVFDRFLGDMKDVNQSYETYLEWEVIRNEVIELIRNGRVKEAVSITKGKEARHIEKLFEETQVMIDFAKLKSESLYLEDMKEEELSKLALVLFSIFLIISCVSISFIISKSISVPIKKLINRIQCIFKDNRRRKAIFVGSEQEMLSEAVTQLEKMGQELKEFNAKLEEKVEQRTKALSESEARQKEAQEIAQLGYWELDIVKNSLVWSDEIFRIFGLAPQEFEATYEAFLEKIHPEDRNWVNKVYTDSLKTKQPYEIEHRLLLKTGEQKYVLEKCKTNFDKKGKPLRSIGTVQDITERKNVEIALQESQKNLFITLHSIGDGVISTDKNGLIIHMNPIAENLCGWKLADAKGKPLVGIFKIVNADTRKTIADPVKKVLEHGEIVGLSNHTVLISRDGTEYQIADSAAPIKTKEGEIQGVVLVFSDVTEKYVAEKKLRDSEEQFRTLYESSNDAAMLLDEKGFFDCNNATLEMFGCASREEFCSKRPADLSPPTQPNGKDSITLSKERIAMAMADGSNRFEWVHRRTNGEDFFAEVLLNVLKLGGHRVLHAVVRDITERKQSEVKLLKAKEQIEGSEERVRALFENMSEGFVLHKILQDKNKKVIDATYVEANKAFELQTGLKRKEVLNKKVTKVLPEIESDSEDFLQIFGKVALTGKPIKLERFSKSFDRWYSISAFSPKQGYVALLFNDITERKEAYDQLQELDTAKDAFLSIASHELRTPMTIIKGYSDFLLSGQFGKLNETQTDFVGRIFKGTEDLLVLVNDVLDLSKLEAGKMPFHFSEIDIQSFLKEELESFRFICKTKKIKLKLSHSGKLKKQIKTDPDKLREIINNLLGNAYKFTPENGTIKIHLEPYEKDKKFLKINIEDTGVGIPDADLKTIFERFGQVENYFHKEYAGTGLGLTIVQKIIGKLGGRIWVESGRDIGANFILLIPYKK